MRARWIEEPRIEGNQELAAKFQVSPLMVRLIRSRTGGGEEEVREFLHGDLSELAKPDRMKGVTEAVALLRKKANEGAHIRIIGDYDIDGVNATHILLTAFGRIGAKADTVIPDRIRDGYGINANLVREAKEAGVDVIVTCDNGIAAVQEIALAKSLGMAVIVTDHHDVPYQEEMGGNRTEVLPPADVIVNPKQSGCPYPYKKLCGAAVAWRLVEALYEAHGIPKEEFLDLAEFAAVATIGDSVELTGENRILVRYGLKRLEQTSNPGYQALLAVNELTGKRLNDYHIGFVIGPCINASGRLDTARRALDLLGEPDRAKAERLAGDLKALNESRKELTAQGTEEAIRKVEDMDLEQNKVLVVYLPDCHESLSGIIAGRIREKYERPCFVLTDGEEGVKGSGRSIPAYHMFDEMTRVREYFTRYGGHPMAAGLSMEKEHVEEFREAINRTCRLTPEDLTPVIRYDAILPIAYVGEQLLRELERMEPFGNGNPRPLFAAGNLRVKRAEAVGQRNRVLRLELWEAEGVSMEGIYFGDAREMMEYVNSRERISILYYPERNEYRGQSRIQLKIRDIR